MIDASLLPPVAVGRKKIAVAGTGYVGLTLAVLLAQHHNVTAVDIIPEKVEKINKWKSPIRDEYIEKYMAEHEERNLSLHATTDAISAYADADFIIVSAPTNYDPKTNFFDCSAEERLERAGVYGEVAVVHDVEGALFRAHGQLERAVADLGVELLDDEVR